MGHWMETLEPRRLFAAGGLDTYFGSAGVADLTAGTGGVVVFDQIQPLRCSVAPDGRILVVGFTTEPPPRENAAALRFNAVGSLDTAFGDDGLVVLSQWTPSAADVSGSSQLQ